MTEGKKLANRLKQTWSKTNNTNWDTMECALRTAKKRIDAGDIDPDLVDAYLVISEALKLEFGAKK